MKTDEQYFPVHGAVYYAEQGSSNFEFVAVFFWKGVHSNENY